MTEDTLICADQGGPARKRYNRRVSVLVVVYMVLVFGSAFLVKVVQPAPAVRYAAAIASGLPLVGMIAALGAYLAEEADEFRRQLLVQAMLWAIGAVMAVTSIWGFVEMLAAGPHLPVFLIFPGFCLVMGIARYLLGRRYR